MAANGRRSSNRWAKEAENNLATYGDRNKVMTTQEETFKMATEDLLQRQIEGRPRRSRSRPSIYGDTKGEKIRGTLKKTNAEKKKAKEEAQKLRAEGLAIIFNHKGANQLTRKGVYQAFAMHTFWARLRTPGKIEESDFVKFFEKCTMARKPDGQEADRLSREDASRLFFNLKCDNKDHLTKEEFMDSIRRFMKVVKATALTEEINIERETTTLRCLGVGEVLEVLSGPTKVRLLVDDDQHQNEEIERLKVQVVMDDQEGWVTAIGNKGIVFLEEYLPAELELALLLARKQAPEPYTWSDYFFWAVVAFVVGYATGGSLYMLMRLL